MRPLSSVTERRQVLLPPHLEQRGHSGCKQTEGGQPRKWHSTSTTTQKRPTTGPTTRPACACSGTHTGTTCVDGYTKDDKISKKHPDPKNIHLNFWGGGDVGKRFRDKNVRLRVMSSLFQAPKDIDAWLFGSRPYCSFIVAWGKNTVIFSWLQTDLLELVTVLTYLYLFRSVNCNESYLKSAVSINRSLKMNYRPFCFL